MAQDCFSPRVPATWHALVQRLLDAEQMRKRRRRNVLPSFPPRCNDAARLCTAYPGHTSRHHSVTTPQHGLSPVGSYDEGVPLLEVRRDN